MPETPARPHPSLRVDRDGAVVAVTLDNADRRNAQTPALWAALEKIAAGLEDSDRVVVLRAEGPSFSAGLDRRLLTPAGVPGEGQSHIDVSALEGYQRAFSAWRDCPALVVAAVQGHAIGAGFQLALAADLRIVADDVCFAMAEVGLGLVPDLGGTWQLARLVGAARALELCVTGRSVGADEAVALGLAQAAVAVDELDAAAHDLADAVLQAPAASVRAVVRLLRDAPDRDLPAQLAAERAAQAPLLARLIG